MGGTAIPATTSGGGIACGCTYAADKYECSSSNVSHMVPPDPTVGGGYELVQVGPERWCG